jgi:hypothetical protein
MLHVTDNDNDKQILIHVEKNIILRTIRVGFMAKAKKQGNSRGL